MCATHVASFVIAAAADAQQKVLDLSDALRGDRLIDTIVVCLLVVVGIVAAALACKKALGS